MAASDLSTILQGMTINELSAHIREAETLLEQKRENARQAFIEEIRQKAETLGFPLETLLSGISTKKASGRDRGESSAERRTVPVKYRDPENSENAWTGRGMKPRWLRDKIDAGAKLEDFLVAA